MCRSRSLGDVVGVRTKKVPNCSKKRFSKIIMSNLQPPGGGSSSKGSNASHSPNGSDAESGSDEASGEWFEIPSCRCLFSSMFLMVEYLFF